MTGSGMRRTVTAATAGLVLMLGTPALAAARPVTTPAAPAAVAAAGAADRHTGAAPMPLPTSPTAYEFGETLAKLNGRSLEITFMAAIIPHHRAAIEMSRLELERGRSADIRTHAENIIANQQHQIEQFTRWLRQWHNLTPEQARAQAPAEARQEMQTMDRETQQRITELRRVPAGERFDVQFVRRMIPHHQAGIIEFLEPQSRAPHAELRVAATSGITTQQAQVADFRTWLSGRS